MFDHIKRWWLAHSAWIAAGFYFLLPSFQAWANTHPKTMLATVVSAVAGRVIQGKAQP